MSNLFKNYMENLTKCRFENLNVYTQTIKAFPEAQFYKEIDSLKFKYITTDVCPYELTIVNRLKQDKNTLITGYCDLCITKKPNGSKDQYTELNITVTSQCELNDFIETILKFRKEFEINKYSLQNSCHTIDQLLQAKDRYLALKNFLKKQNEFYIERQAGAGKDEVD